MGKGARRRPRGILTGQQIPPPAGNAGAISGYAKP